MAGLVHYKYSHSTRASTEYFGYEYEYEYLRLQISEYEYEYWNSVLEYYEYEYQVFWPQPWFYTSFL